VRVDRANNAITSGQAARTGCYNAAMDDSALTFRAATADDAQTLVQMINAMARTDRYPDLDIDAQHRLIRDAFEKKRFNVVLAEWQGVVAGYVAFFEGYSTFRAAPTLQVDDLYVKNEFRGRHVAFELFRYVLQEAKRRECARVEWRIIEGNEEAFGFYERFQSKRLQGWIHYRLNRDDIQRMA
jgi:GNAT superfamily N-acetyltransferase